jgi:hypothetical protein
MRAAYCASNCAADDKEDGNDDRRDPPSRAIPRHLREILAITILQLPFLSEGYGAGAVSLRSSMLLV